MTASTWPKKGILLDANIIGLNRIRALFKCSCYCTGDPLCSLPKDPSAHLGEGLRLLVSMEGKSGAILLKATDSLTFRTSLRGSLLIPASVERGKGCDRYIGRCSRPGHSKFTGWGTAWMLTICLAVWVLCLTISSPITHPCKVTCLSFSLWHRLRHLWR